MLSLICLALMEATGSYIRYIINGNWVISWPGEFIAAGTVIKYERTEHYESFSAVGPTTTDLHVMVSYHKEKTLIFTFSVYVTYC